MHPIKRDTIIKVGDKVLDTKLSIEWEVMRIEGWKFLFRNAKGEERIFSKLDLTIMPELKLIPAGGRGYF
jgi:hypothetical protein